MTEVIVALLLTPVVVALSAYLALRMGTTGYLMARYQFNKKHKHCSCNQRYEHGE